MSSKIKINIDGLNSKYTEVRGLLVKRRPSKTSTILALQKEQWNDCYTLSFYRNDAIENARDQQWSWANDSVDTYIYRSI